jgi:hypothetical protein
MAGVESPWKAAMGAHRRGEREGEKEGDRGGDLLGLGGRCRGAPCGWPLGAAGCPCVCVLSICYVLCAGRREGRRKERKKRKENIRKKEKIWKIFQT